MGSWWTDICNLVIRPPRCDYNVDELGDSKEFTVAHKTFIRHDFQLDNRRGYKLECSFYERSDEDRPVGPTPCVIYCHGNCGCRLDAFEILYQMLPINISVLAMDFAGCGKSEGQYISLGYFESDDIACAVEYCRSAFGVSKIALWGRSMGAVAALLYCHKDPAVAGVVVDSPFSSLPVLCSELAEDNRGVLPKALARTAIGPLRRSIRNRAGFDIDDVAPMNVASEIFVPAIFGHGSDDNFVLKHHTDDIVAKYGGECKKIIFPGDHNETRPEYFYASGASFLYQVLVQGSIFDESDKERPSVRMPAACDFRGPRDDDSDDDDVSTSDDDGDLAMAKSMSMEK